MQVATIFNALLHFVAVVLLAVDALLPIVNPPGGAPIYLAMTANLTPEERSRMAKPVAINSFLLLIASALIGAYVLDLFGLSVPTVQVAGGIVVCAVAWSLLDSANSPPALQRIGSPAASPDDLSQRAFYPMTMPLTVGPGSISVALTLGANPPPGFRSLLATALAHAVGILIVAVSVHPFVYRRSDLLERNPRAGGK